MIDLNDPVMAARLLAAVDSRVEQVLAARMPKVAYGVVDSVDATNRRCAVFVSGATTSTPSIAYPRHLIPSVGVRVRVVITPGGDHYIDAQMTGNGAPRFVPLATRQVALNATTAAGIGNTLVELTSLPATGVVAAEVLLLCSTTVAGTGTYFEVLHYGDSSSTDPAPVRAYAGAVAGYSTSCAGMVQTGGTNSRQIRYDVALNVGTVTYILIVTGYWTTE